MREAERETDTTEEAATKLIAALDGFARFLRRADMPGNAKITERSSALLKALLAERDKLRKQIDDRLNEEAHRRSW